MAMDTNDLKRLRALQPCADALQWLERQTDYETAWQQCQRSDWMLWLLAKVGDLTAMEWLAINVAMIDTPLGDGRTVEALLTDERSRAFVDLKRRKLAGEAIELQEWYTAAAAADAAADEAAAYAAAAADAAYAAAADAAYADAAAATYAAATDAAYAAYAAAAAVDAAADAAAGAARKWQAGKIREVVPLARLLAAALEGEAMLRAED